MKLTEVSDLAVARRRVADGARILGLAVADIRMAEVAAGEVIASAFRHGIMPGQVRVWGSDGAVTVRVDSSGRGEAVATPAPAPGSAAARGRSWVARQLADVVNVEIRPTPPSLSCSFRYRSDQCRDDG